MKKSEIRKQINTLSIIVNFIEKLYAQYAEENNLSYNEYLVLPDLIVCPKPCRLMQHISYGSAGIGRQVK